MLHWLDWGDRRSSVVALGNGETKYDDHLVADLELLTLPTFDGEMFVSGIVFSVESSPVLW